MAALGASEAALAAVMMTAAATEAGADVAPTAMATGLKSLKFMSW